jgi:hypothetical protein
VKNAIKFAPKFREKGEAITSSFSVPQSRAKRDLAVRSFAGDVVGHGVNVAGKDTAKAASVTVTATGKAGVKVVKFLV